MKRSERGFTLIELLCAIAIIGILAAMGVQAFSNYRNRSYEATAIHYMRNWIPAQELYLQVYGHYADDDAQLQSQLHVLKTPTKVPYNFTVDSTSSATTLWFGRATPTKTGLRYFYIDNSGRLQSSMSGPPPPPP